MIDAVHNYYYIVELQNIGHNGTSYFVLCREVVLSLGVNTMEGTFRSIPL